MNKRYHFLLLTVLVIFLSACSKSSNNNGDDPTPEPVVTKDLTHVIGTLPPLPASVWAAGDELRLMTLDDVRQNKYTLTEGQGAVTATFTLSSGTTELVERSSQLYAYTPNNYIEGIWASDGKIPELGQKIPGSYSAKEVASRDGIVPRPVTCWGTASFGNDSVLHTALQQLTAQLSVPASSVPNGTIAIVLVTHSQCMLNGKKISGGSGEALSGLFTALLKDGAKLVEDEDFICRDSLRVNFDSSIVYDRLYIPLIAGTYSRLSVIAVTEDTKDDYSWKGTEIKTFTNRSVTVGEVLE